MRKLLNLILSVSVISLCLFQLPAQADNENAYTVDSHYSCGDIVDNYMDAIGEFNSVLVAMLPLSDQKSMTTALNGAIKGIKNNNVTFNALQAYEGAINDELKKHPNPALNEGMSQLKSQLASLHTRVNQWKKSHCREKHACDLGEPGYCSKKHDLFY